MITEKSNMEVQVAEQNFSQMKELVTILMTRNPGAKE